MSSQYSDICVLGAGGFLGSHLVAELAHCGCRVRAFDRHLPKNPLLTEAQRSQINNIEGDFFNPRDLDRALNGCSVCFHLISTTLPQTSNVSPAQDVRQNLAGTLDMLDKAKELGVKKIVFSSSGGTVYGVPQTQLISEDHPSDPICSYGVVKLATEKYLLLYSELYGLDYTILRIANPYGPLQKTHALQGIIGVFLGKILQDEALTVWGDGSVVRDYLYVGDVARAFVAAMGLETEHRVFNIGSGTGISINEIITSLCQVTGKTITARYKKGRTFDVPYSVLDISRAKQELGWEPQMPFEEGIKKTWDWLQTANF